MASRRSTAAGSTQKNIHGTRTNARRSRRPRTDADTAVTTRPAARLDDETLIGLIEDVRAKPRRAPKDVEAYERSLAELLAEAACRNLLGCITIDLEEVRARATKVDQDELRTAIQRAATLQQLQRFATHLAQADLNGLWAAFRWAAMFQDENEKFLALQHVAYRLTSWLLDDADDVEQMEMYRTEQLAQSTAPGRWLEQEIRRLFHRTLEKAGNPTRPASAADNDEDEVRSSRRPRRDDT